MKGKTVIVTGGSSGIGKGIVKMLCEKQANVVIVGRNEEKLAKTKAELETFPNQIFTYAMDVREVDQIQRCIEATKNRFGSIDGLVNNAAGNFVVPAEDISPNGWRAVIDIVLHGTWFFSQAVAKDWIRDGKKGSILNIVATYAWTGSAGVVHSASAKAGVLAMSQSLAVEWGSKYGIRVNCIAPGMIENTGGAEKLIMDERVASKLKQSIPLKRFGTPEEIGKLACFLLSADAEYMNGECVTMDGGHWISGFRFL